MNIRAAWAALLVPLAACGEYTVPAAHVTNARNAIQAASAAGAAQSVRARPYLVTAQSELSKAMESTGKGADLLLLRSQVDAEVALGITREEALREQAVQADDRARALSAPPSRP
jgi:hypothetical protein